MLPGALPRKTIKPQDLDCVYYDEKTIKRKGGAKKEASSSE